MSQTTHPTIITLDKAMHQKLIAADKQWQTAFEQLPLDKANAILALCDDTHAYAWLSLWWENTPRYQNFKTACIGNYYAQTLDASQQILNAAQTILRQHNAQYVIAPMDGNTWHNYRLTSQIQSPPQTEPAFFLETLTPPEWNHYFQVAQFQCIANYASTCNTELDYVENAAPEWQKRFASDPAYQLKNLDLEHIDSQLEELYTLSIQGFQNNFLYTDISLAEFKALYQPVLPLVVPKLVQMAYVRGQLAGFAFAVPDYAQKQRNQTVDTLILKTFVRHPDATFKGLGTYLMWNTYQIARAHGYKRVITAFMHEDNASLHLSLKTGQIIRKYALYGKQL